MDELSGMMVERVAIENFIDARDAAGAGVGNWQAAGNAWAAIAPDGGGTSLGEARRSRRRWRVTLRPRLGGDATIGLTSRLIWRGEWLAVLAVETDPRRPDRVVLRCEARAA